MSSKGTDVHLQWNEPKPEDLLWQQAKHVINELIHVTQDQHLFKSDNLGAFSITFRGSAPDKLISEAHIVFYECDVLPELAVLDTAFMRGENACRECYHFIKKLFIALDADWCCGTTRADEVRPFDFSDTFICRAFKFTKLGPQKLILPYEEGRAIIDSPIEPNGYSDTRFNHSRREPNWVLHLDGPLQ